jgi:hypothetical protein
MAEAPDFHSIAWQQFILAMLEGKHEDSEYVKQKAYEVYEASLKLCPWEHIGQ